MINKHQYGAPFKSIPQYFSFFFKKVKFAYINRHYPVQVQIIQHDR